MVTIKRYPNRKLYNTEAKQYITLEGVADLIRQGAEIQVVDHASGEDLTALTLTQITLEQEKKRFARFTVSQTRCGRSPVRPTRPLTIINATCESMS